MTPSVGRLRSAIPKSEAGVSASMNSSTNAPGSKSLSVMSPLVFGIAAVYASSRMDLYRPSSKIESAFRKLTQRDCYDIHRYVLDSSARAVCPIRIVNQRTQLFSFRRRRDPRGFGGSRGSHSQGRRTVLGRA